MSAQFPIEQYQDQMKKLITDFQVKMPKIDSLNHQQFHIGSTKISYVDGVQWHNSHYYLRVIGHYRQIIETLRELQQRKCHLKYIGKEMSLDEINSEMKILIEQHNEFTKELLNTVKEEAAWNRRCGLRVNTEIAYVQEFHGKRINELYLQPMKESLEKASEIIKKLADVERGETKVEREKSATEVKEVVAETAAAPRPSSPKKP